MSQFNNVIIRKIWKNKIAELHEIDFLNLTTLIISLIFCVIYIKINLVKYFKIFI